MSIMKQFSKKTKYMRASFNANEYLHATSTGLEVETGAVWCSKAASGGGIELHDGEEGTPVKVTVLSWRWDAFNSELPPLLSCVPGMSSSTNGSTIDFWTSNSTFASGLVTLSVTFEALIAER